MPQSLPDMLLAVWAVCHPDLPTVKGMAHSAALNVGVNLHRKPWRNDRILNIVMGLLVAGLFYPLLKPIIAMWVPTWHADALEGLAVIVSAFWAFFVKWGLEILWNAKESVIHWIRARLGAK